MRIFKAEDEDLVEVMVKLYATIADSRGNACNISQILHTLCVSIVDNSTMP